ANTDANVPSANVFTTSAIAAAGPAALTLNSWTHLAMTWDGTTLRLFEDAAEVAEIPAPAPLLTSNGNLRIGGDSLRSEFFSGLIDELRVYNRALTSDQIQADMNKPVDP